MSYSSRYSTRKRHYINRRTKDSINRFSFRISAFRSSFCGHKITYQRSLAAIAVIFRSLFSDHFQVIIRVIYRPFIRVIYRPFIAVIYRPFLRLSTGHLLRSSKDHSLHDDSENSLIQLSKSSSYRSSIKALQTSRHINRYIQHSFHSFIHEAYELKKWLWV